MLNINKVELLIKERGWSNSYFSKLMGRSATWISDWKRGHFPDDEMIAKIADKLDTTVEYLTDQTDIKEKPSPDMGRLNDEDKEFLMLYRQASPELREAIRRILKPQ